MLNEWHRKHAFKSVRLGVAAGLVGGLYVWLLTAYHLLMPECPYGGQDYLHMLMGMYPGFEMSWERSFFGFGWAFVTNFVLGWLLGTIYNAMTCCVCHSDCMSHEGGSSKGKKEKDSGKHSS